MQAFSWDISYTYRLYLFLVLEFFKGLPHNLDGSDVVISVVHPEAIADQNPYDELTYENLPESP